MMLYSFSCVINQIKFNEMIMIFIAKNVSYKILKSILLDILKFVLCKFFLKILVINYRIIFLDTKSKLNLFKKNNVS